MSPQAALSSIFGDLDPQLHACPHAAEFLNRLIQRIEGVIEERISIVAHSNPLEASTPRGEKKRRRVDEHMKMAVLQTVVKEGRAPNCPSWCRATQKASVAKLETIGRVHLPGRVVGIGIGWLVLRRACRSGQNGSGPAQFGCLVFGFFEFQGASEHDRVAPR